MRYKIMDGSERLLRNPLFFYNNRENDFNFVKDKNIDKNGWLEGKTNLSTKSNYADQIGSAGYPSLFDVDLFAALFSL